jgi:membrane protease YdiL (CAAX protease family)
LRWPTAVALVVALGTPPLISAWAARHPLDSALSTQLLLQAAYCALPIFLLLFVRYGERLRLSSIGFHRPTGSTIVTGVALAVILVIVLPMLTDPLVRRWAHPGVDRGVAQLAALPIWFRIVLSVTGGPIEELVYRGYAIERIAELTRRRWLGATIALAVFTAAHIPAWGAGFALAADLPAGIVLTLFYLWRRDLAANMLGHAAALVVAMFTVVPRAAPTIRL